MTSVANHAEQRLIVLRTTLRRECFLPPDITGTVVARQGQRVDGTSIVARGQLPARHHIVNAADDLRLRNPEDLAGLLLVQVGQRVEKGEVLAGRSAKRGRRAFSPADGEVAAVEAGRIIVREDPKPLELPAGMQGHVTRVIPGRGVVVETAGAVLQGVWGNNQRAVGMLKMELDDGLEFIQGDEINTEWRQSIVITQQPLAHTGLTVMEEQSVAGVIAPSMDATLYDVVKEMNRAVILTEGFGNMRMSNAVVNMLTELTGQYYNLQATIDAVLPTSLEARRPEVLVTIPLRENEAVEEVQIPEQLRPGTAVRVTRPPYQGQTARVVSIPKRPEMLEHKMRVTAAIIETAGGEQVPVPIANLEVFAGKSESG